MADQQKVVYGLSNGTVFNDLEELLTQFSRLRYFWRWISHKRLKIMAIVIMEDE